MVVPHLITIILRTGAQMQSGEPGSKLLHESIYSRVWEQDTPAGSFLEIILRAGNAQLLRRHIANELNVRSLRTNHSLNVRL